MADRCCVVCGKALHRKPGEGGQTWKARQVCDRACDLRRRRAARIVPPPKTCVVCGRPFVARPDEPACKFAKRTTCRAKCAAARRAQSARENVLGRKEDQEAIERRCRENIERYWRERGAQVTVAVTARGDGVYEVASNLVAGVPR